MLETKDPGQPTQVVYIASTRNYNTAHLHVLLAGAGYTIVDRPYDASSPMVLASLNPSLVVLLIDPASERDLGVLQVIRQAARCPLLVVGPGHRPAGFAEALKAGAQVCLHEHDGPGVIVAQIDAILRASRGERSEPRGAITIGELVVDVDRRQVLGAGQRIHLAPIEFKILAFLAANAGRVLSPCEIMAAVHEYAYSEVEARNVVKVYIRRIRQKLEAVSPGPEYIVNARGFGYMLDRRQGQGALPAPKAAEGGDRA